MSQQDQHHNEEAVELSSEEAEQMVAITTAIISGVSELDEVEAWDTAHELGYTIEDDVR